MGRVGDTDLLLLGCDLAVEIGRDPEKISGHDLDLGDPPTLFVNLEALEAHLGIPRLHTQLRELD